MRTLFLNLLIFTLLAGCQATKIPTMPVTDALPHALAPLKKITVGNHQIAFWEGGKGKEVLLFVHGLGSNSSFWKENLPAFTEGYRVIAIDLPGYGASSKEQVPATMPWFADQVAAFLTAMRIEKVTYVGLSMGGQIGMTLALQHPDKVSKLVLVSAAGIETFDEKARTSLRNFMTVKSIMEATDPQITTSIALNFDTYDAPKFGWLVEQRKAWKTRPDFRAYAEVNEKSVSGMLDGAVYEQLDVLHLPVLVLYGKGDKMIPNRFFNPGLTTADIASRAGSALHNAKVELVEKAGHLLPLEQPEAFNRVLLTWLKNSPSK